MVDITLYFVIHKIPDKATQNHFDLEVHEMHVFVHLKIEYLDVL